MAIFNSYVSHFQRVFVEILADRYVIGQFKPVTSLKRKQTKQLHTTADCQVNQWDEHLHVFFGNETILAVYLALFSSSHLIYDDWFHLVDNRCIPDFYPDNA